jgi:hypothetical protein
MLHSEAMDMNLPRHIIPEQGQYVCPGSMCVPTADGTCLCGLPLGAHVWTSANGVVRLVTDEEHEKYLNYE